MADVEQGSQRRLPDGVHFLPTQSAEALQRAKVDYETKLARHKPRS